MAAPTGKVTVKVGTRKRCTIRLVRSTYLGSPVYLTSYTKVRRRLRWA